MAIDKHLRIKSRHGYTIAAELRIPDGKGPFPLVVFAHGYRSSKGSSKIMAIMAAIQDRYACLRFDFSGHGESEGDFESITPTRGAEDMEDVIASVRQHAAKDLKKIDATRLAFFGSSFGGGVALLVAARHPELKALILFAPASDYRFRKAACEEARRQGKQIITVPFNRTGTLPIRCQMVEDGLRHDFYALTKTIRCPTIIFHGDKDEVIPLEFSRRLKDALPKGRLDIIPGADHLFNDDERLLDELVARCRKFLDEQALSRM